MSVEPSTDNIDFFLSIAECVSKADAVRWLKVPNHLKVDFIMQG